MKTFSVRRAALVWGLTAVLGASSAFAQLSEGEGRLTPGEQQAAAKAATLFDGAMSLLAAPKPKKTKGKDSGAVTGPSGGIPISLAQAAEQMAADAAYSAQQFALKLQPPAAGPGFGGVEALIGADGRIRVTNTTLTPFNAICRLRVTFPNGNVYSGTASFVGRRVLLSNAHMVYSKADGGWATRIEVTPGQNGTSKPFGSQFAIDARIPTGWLSNESNRDFDMSWIILPDATLFNRVGFHFGYATTTDSQLKSMSINLSGYHGDKNGEQWRAFGGGNQQVKALQFNHFLDTMPGASGSPVWQLRSDGSRYVVGAHCAGLTNVRNIATRMSTGYFNVTKDLKARNP